MFGASGEGKDLLFWEEYSMLGRRRWTEMFERISEKTFADIFPLLEEAFPVTELRTRENQRRLRGEPGYRLYGVKGKDEPYTAALACWEIEDFLYIEHFAVKEGYRGSGYGGYILDTFLEGQNKPVVLEVEVPEDGLTRRRVAFYERHGFVFHTYPYLQPPMRQGQNPLPLRLMTKPKAIDEETYKRYKKWIHRVVYRFEGEL